MSCHAQAYARNILDTVVICRRFSNFAILSRNFAMYAIGVCFIFHDLSCEVWCIVTQSFEIIDKMEPDFINDGTTVTLSNGHWRNTRDVNNRLESLFSPLTLQDTMIALSGGGFGFHEKVRVVSFLIERLINMKVACAYCRTLHPARECGVDAKCWRQCDRCKQGKAPIANPKPRDVLLCYQIREKAFPWQMASELQEAIQIHNNGDIMGYFKDDLKKGIIQDLIPYLRDALQGRLVLDIVNKVLKPLARLSGDLLGGGDLPEFTGQQFSPDPVVASAADDAILEQNANLSVWMWRAANGTKEEHAPLPSNMLDLQGASFVSDNVSFNKTERYALEKMEHSSRKLTQEMMDLMAMLHETPQSNPTEQIPLTIEPMPVENPVIIPVKGLEAKDLEPKEEVDEAEEEADQDADTDNTSCSDDADFDLDSEYDPFTTGPEEIEVEVPDEIEVEVDGKFENLVETTFGPNFEMMDEQMEDLDDELEMLPDDDLRKGMESFLKKEAEFEKEDTTIMEDPKENLFQSGVVEEKTFNEKKMVEEEKIVEDKKLATHCGLQTLPEIIEIYKVPEVMPAVVTKKRKFDKICKPTVIGVCLCEEFDKDMKEVPCKKTCPALYWDKVWKAYENANKELLEMA